VQDGLVQTPERIALRLPVAGLGPRTAAWALDALVQFLAWSFLLMIGTLVAARPIWEELQALQTAAQVAVTGGVFALNWGYHAAFEALWHGRSPGKRLVGLRVVKADGTPAGAIEAVLRNLARLVDALPFGYAVGLVTLAVTPARRVGDLLAGTRVIWDRPVDLAALDALAEERPMALPGLAPLPLPDARLVRDFLARRELLEPAARARVALAVAELPLRGADEVTRARHLASPEAAEALLASLDAGAPP